GVQLKTTTKHKQEYRQRVHQQSHSAFSFLFCDSLRARVMQSKFSRLFLICLKGEKPQPTNDGTSHTSCREGGKAKRRPRRVHRHVTQIKPKKRREVLESA